MSPKYTAIALLLFAWFLIMGHENCFAQSITGKVTDDKGTSLPGTNIQLYGSGIGTVTDSSGFFRIDPATIDTAYQLIISRVGFTAQQVITKGNEFLEIILLQDNQSLSDVVVVGYGTQKKETVTGAISTLSGAELVQSPVANISNSLAGRIAGISAVQASGEPGYNTSTIRLRGISTLNDGGQDPLIVIDGIQSTVNIMNVLDPNDIENVSVLKDASATAIYGVKGANGVIIITTKRGKTGKPKIDMSANYGLSALTTKLKMLGSYDYAIFRNEALKNDYGNGDASIQARLFTDDDLWKFQNNRDYTPAEVAAMNITDEQKKILLGMPSLSYQSHDYFAEQFGKVSPQQQYNINVSGGGDLVKYFTSVGYFSQLGVFNNSSYDGYNINPRYNRYNFRSNVDINAIKNFTISIDLSGQFEDKTNMIGSSNDGNDASMIRRNKALLGQFYSTTPFAGPGFMDGKLIAGYIWSTKYPMPNLNVGGGFSPLSYTFNHPMLQTINSNLIANIKVTHSLNYLLPGLSATATFSYNDVYSKSLKFQKSVRQYNVMRNPDDPTQYLYYETTTSMPYVINDNYSNYKMNHIYFEGKIDYSKQINKHNFTGLLLYNINRTSDPGLLYNVANTIIGSAGRATYNYDQRYLLEFNGAYNGSENFPPGKRFGFFPAASAGWVISKEHFYPQDAFVTWLKLRGSYGVVGNDMIGGGRFLYLPGTWTAVANGYYFGPSGGGSQAPYYPGSTESSVGNPDVTWEKSKKANLGLEINLFKDKLSLIGDVFKENRDNLLWTSLSTPAIVSRFLPPANIGKMENKGYELQLAWKDQIGTDFYYGIKANLSYARNKILFMDEPSNSYNWLNATGFAYGQYKGFKTNGFYNTSEETFNRPYSSIDANKVQPGDMKYIDINGDGIIDRNDKVPIGNSNLPRYYFGSTVNFGYKGLELAVLFTGSAKGTMTMWSSEASSLVSPFFMLYSNSFAFQYDNRWTPEAVATGQTPSFPRASTLNNSNQNGANQSDFWLMPTDFIKLKNVELSYRFTNLGKMKRMGLSGIRIYVSGNNLHTWKKSKLLDGFDPEQADVGSAATGYIYPPTQIYNAGLNLQF